MLPARVTGDAGTGLPAAQKSGDRLDPERFAFHLFTFDFVSMAAD
jgi:hypothetical protein